MEVHDAYIRGAKRARVSVHPHAHVYSVWNVERRRRGLPTSLPEPRHRCTSECTFFRVTPSVHTDYRTYLVCEAFSTIHLCGGDCTERELLPKNEGYVCRLTGVCIKAPILSNFTSVPRDPNKAVCSGGVIRMGTGKRAGKRSMMQEQNILSRKIRERVNSRVMSVFSSRQRRGIYDRQLQRLFVETDKLFRVHKITIPIVDIDIKIRKTIEAFGAFLNAPPPLFRSSLQLAITSDFYDYFKRVCEISAKDSHPIEWVPRQADIFTACM